MTSAESLEPIRRRADEATAGPYLSIDRDELTGGMQLSINDGNGGYRIFGPKYCGQSVTLRKHVLTKRDVAEIRSYLRQVKS